MNDWTDQFKNVMEAVAILVGGGWAFYHFVLFRERFPSMEIENGIKYVGENEKEYLLELFCIIANKGKVRKWIAPFDFELLFLNDGEPFMSNSEINEEINFSKFKRNITYYGNRKFWVYPTWYIPFVDGESKKRFTHITAVPKSFKYLTLNTRFIDFKNKNKAVKFILSQNSGKKIEIGKQWSEMSFEERLAEVGSKKTDFYYTQVYTSIDEVKKNSTQQGHC